MSRKKYSPKYSNIYINITLVNRYLSTKLAYLNLLILSRKSIHTHDMASALAVRHNPMPFYSFSEFHFFPFNQQSIKKVWESFLLSHRKIEEMLKLHTKFVLPKYSLAHFGISSCDWPNNQKE